MKGEYFEIVGKGHSWTVKAKVRFSIAQDAEWHDIGSVPGCCPRNAWNYIVLASSYPFAYELRAEIAGLLPVHKLELVEEPVTKMAKLFWRGHLVAVDYGQNARLSVIKVMLESACYNMRMVQDIARMLYEEYSMAGEMRRYREMYG